MLKRIKGIHRLTKKREKRIGRYLLKEIDIEEGDAVSMKRELTFSSKFETRTTDVMLRMLTGNRREVRVEGVSPPTAPPSALSVGRYWESVAASASDEFSDSER